MIRPTKSTYGSRTPYFSRAARDSTRSYSVVSIPLPITWTRDGSSAGYASSTSSRIAVETAITASAPSRPVRSHQLESR